MSSNLAIKEKDINQNLQQENTTSNKKEKKNNNNNKEIKQITKENKETKENKSIVDSLPENITKLIQDLQIRKEDKNSEDTNLKGSVDKLNQLNEQLVLNVEEISTLFKNFNKAINADIRNPDSISKTLLALQKAVNKSVEVNKSLNCQEAIFNRFPWLYAADRCQKNLLSVRDSLRLSKKSEELSGWNATITNHIPTITSAQKTIADKKNEFEKILVERSKEFEEVITKEEENFKTAVKSKIEELKKTNKFVTEEELVKFENKELETLKKAKLDSLKTTALKELEKKALSELKEKDLKLKKAIDELILIRNKYKEFKEDYEKVKKEGEKIVKELEDEIDVVNNEINAKTHNPIGEKDIETLQLYSREYGNIYCEKNDLNDVQEQHKLTLNETNLYKNKLDTYKSKINTYMKDCDNDFAPVEKLIGPTAHQSVLTKYFYSDSWFSYADL